MKQLLLTLLFVCSTSLAASTIYVSPSGTASQSGQSWTTATSLVNAISNAQSDDEIWVAEGTYLPGTSRTSTFSIPAGVRLYGGFSGTEQSREQRDVAQYASILSGNIGDLNDREDNVYTIVTMINTGGKTVLDGFVLTEGEARAFDRKQTMTTTGAALYINGSRNGQGPVIANCNFISNHARSGGAVFINGSNLLTRPQFVNCIFNENKADLKGGAIYCQGTDGNASPILDSCYFQANKADRGACLLNDGTNGNSSPMISNCTFEANQALTDGAVIYNIVLNNNGMTGHVMNASQMINNDSYMGNDIASNYQVEERIRTNAVHTSGGTLHATPHQD